MALDLYHSAITYILMGLAGCSVAIAVLVFADHYFRERIPPRPDRWRCLCGFQTTNRFRWWLHRVRSWPFK